MSVVGLTGGIGSGKSTACGMLAGLGAYVIDADAIARELLDTEGPVQERVLARFGQGLRRPDGSVDRQSLASLVFGDQAALQALNSLTHPAIRQVMDARLRAALRRWEPGHVVMDIPLLGPQDRHLWPLDGVIVVDADPEVALRRLVGDRGMALADARARIAAQPGRADRLELADLVIDNSADLTHLSGQVQQAWTWIHTLHCGP